jgi:hypothetical protein
MFLSLRGEDLDNFLDPQFSILEIILLKFFLFFIPKILQRIRIHKRNKGVQKKKKKNNETFCLYEVDTLSEGWDLFRCFLYLNKETYAFITPKICWIYDPEKAWIRLRILQRSEFGSLLPEIQNCKYTVCNKET